MSITIEQIGITTLQERTWGRVYVDYTQDGQSKFIFRNYIYFEKKNFSGQGSFEIEVAYTWFDEQETTQDYEAVLEGEYDYMYLTPENHKVEYGTPSVILRSLIQDIDQGFLDEIDTRRGWFKK
jgi:hypothetical protein